MKINLREIKTNLNPLDVYYIFKNEENTILLDSSKEDVNLSKFSFIGINPFLIFESKNKDIYINDKKISGDPFYELEKLINKYKISFDLHKEMPFISGCIGYISYDTGRILEELPNTTLEDYDIPDMRFIFYKNLIVFDLIKNKKYITALGINHESENSNQESTNPNNESEKLLDEIENRILTATSLNEIEIDAKEKRFSSNFTKDEYKLAIKKLKDYIVSGDVYIANMTQRFCIENFDESIDIYRKLRATNKAPFSAYMNFNDFQVISSSPERFIQIIDSKVHTRPIKGTRPRGMTKEEDAQNRLELINSEKDKAELLMIVDLERNDLSKVCKNNSINVTEIFKIEEYKTVFHLVSTIEGELKDSVSAIKCIKECFPGGSITGAPKIRAMEIIEELEGLKRNIYTGSIGYFDFRGNADFNIVIRSIIKKDNKAYFGVGGGITYDSIEEDEYNETLDKAKALRRVL